jgi:protein-tyrosine phosphatase
VGDSWESTNISGSCQNPSVICIQEFRDLGENGDNFMTINPWPILKSYWVIPGRFRAGEYPSGVEEAEARGKLLWLLNLGIDYFIDLTEEGEPETNPYDGILNEEAEEYRRTVLHRQLSIPDFSIPSQERMTQILDMIDEALSAGRNIYLHCLGGRGRTGTVVGCHLVRHGMAAEQALEKIQELRRGMPDENRQSPENVSQRRMVKQWTKGK